MPLRCWRQLRAAQLLAATACRLTATACRSVVGGNCVPLSCCSVAATACRSAATACRCITLHSVTSGRVRRSTSSCRSRSSRRPSCTTVAMPHDNRPAHAVERDALQRSVELEALIGRERHEQAPRNGGNRVVDVKRSRRVLLVRSGKHQLLHSDLGRRHRLGRHGAESSSCTSVSHKASSNLRTSSWS